jgi:hypothetical protein
MKRAAWIVMALQESPGLPADVLDMQLLQKKALVSQRVDRGLGEKGGGVRRIE